MKPNKMENPKFSHIYCFMVGLVYLVKPITNTEFLSFYLNKKKKTAIYYSDIKGGWINNQKAIVGGSIMKRTKVLTWKCVSIIWQRVSTDKTCLLGWTQGVAWRGDGMVKALANKLLDRMAKWIRE